MQYVEIVKAVVDILEEYDAERPTHKAFQAGIGPFGEPQIVGVIARRLTLNGTTAITKRPPDLVIQREWALEFKIVRPYGDNGKEAENWSVNMLHPFPGSASLIGDALKLVKLEGYPCKGLFVIGFEHLPAKLHLDPLLDSFELIAKHVAKVDLSHRIEERREGLCHPEHQVLRCIAWEVIS
jgi:hypothetical protein